MGHEVNTPNSNLSGTSNHSDNGGGTTIHTILKHVVGYLVILLGQASIIGVRYLIIRTTVLEFSSIFGDVSSLEILTFLIIVESLKRVKPTTLESYHHHHRKETKIESIAYFVSILKLFVIYGILELVFWVL